MAHQIGLPNFNPQTSRAVNSETSARLRELVATYLAAQDVAREVRLELGTELTGARAAGHSFAQLSEASGLSLATIQNILRAVSVERLHRNRDPQGSPPGRHHRQGREELPVGVQHGDGTVERAVPVNGEELTGEQARELASSLIEAADEIDRLR